MYRPKSHKIGELPECVLMEMQYERLRRAILKVDPITGKYMAEDLIKQNRHKQGDTYVTAADMKIRVDKIENLVLFPIPTPNFKNPEETL